MAHFPLSLDLAGRRTVLVGGGRVALRRARAFAEAGAQVIVIAPQVVPELAAMAADGTISWEARRYASGDLAGAWLVHTATGVPRVDELVSADAAAGHLWCIDATDAARASAHVPARRVVDSPTGPVTIAVNASANPVRARTIATQLAAALTA